MTTGLAVFDTTVNETNQWLKEVEFELFPCDRHQAYIATRAVMHALRDRLSPGGAMRLAAQLPMLLRGAFVEGWRPDETPVRSHSLEAFVSAVGGELPSGFPFEAETVARSVIKAFASQMGGGAIDKVMGEVPEDIRRLWPEPALIA